MQNENTNKKPEFPPTNSAGRQLVQEINDTLGPDGKRVVEERIWARTSEARLRRSEDALVEEIKRAHEQQKRDKNS